MSSAGSPVASPALTALLSQLISTSITTSLYPTALFLSERFFALSPTCEDAIFYLSLSLLKAGNVRQTIHLLRHASVESPTLVANKKSVKEAYRSSLRIALVYSLACEQVGRSNHAKDNLASVAANGPFGGFKDSLSSNDTALILSSPQAATNVSPSLHLNLTLARLAQQANKLNEAAAYYSKALKENWWCWQAFEALCHIGQAPNADGVFAALPVPVVNPVTNPQPSEPPARNKSRLQSVSAPTEEPPLLNKGKTALNGLHEPMGMDTRFGDGMNMGLGIEHNAMSVGMSIDDSTLSVEDSYYGASAPTTRVNGTGGGGLFGFAASNVPAVNGRKTNSNSLFTPTAGPSTSQPYVAQPITRGPPAIKRGRSQVSAVETPVASTSSSPEIPRRIAGQGSAANAPRRSTRLTVAPPHTKNISAGLQIDMAKVVSRDKLSDNSRDKKRSKGGIASGEPESESLSVSLSSNGLPLPSRLTPNPNNYLISSPSSPRPSPFPPDSATFASSQAMVEQVQAENWIRSQLRLFGKSLVFLSYYETSNALKTLQNLPAEQARSHRALIYTAHAHFESLNYPIAEKSFSAARQLMPFMLDSMDRFSTLLWHLGRKTELSFLAQECMAVDCRQPESWIAAGNVFSALEDHPNALKCFKRACQLEDEKGKGRAYPWTLAGHECVSMEEWVRATQFYTDAVRRDPRHYNAWFGLGNVYMRTGKYRLAEFHFRKASDINPSNAMLVCCVGTVLEKVGKKKEALEMYEQACLLAPNSPAVRFKRVRVLISMRQYSLALRDLLLVKEHAPEEFNVHFLLGRLYGMMGQKNNMTKHLTYAQDLDPRSAHRIREVMENNGHPKEKEEDSMQEDLEDEEAE